VFVLAVPLSTVVIHVLAANDAAFLLHYTAAPHGHPWAHRIVAGVKQLMAAEGSASSQYLLFQL
jgi:hypothetical protein